MPAPSVCQPESPAWQDKKAFIDVHCHAFNILDLPIKGFVQKVFLNSDEEPSPEILDNLVELLSKLVQSSPLLAREDERLDQLLAAGPQTKARGRPGPPMAMASGSAISPTGVMGSDMNFCLVSTGVMTAPTFDLHGRSP